MSAQDPGVATPVERPIPAQSDSNKVRSDDRPRFVFGGLKTSLGVVVFWSVVAVLVAIADINGTLAQIANGLGPTLTAIASGTLALIGIILTHFFTRLREQDNAFRQRLAEQERQNTERIAAEDRATREARRKSYAEALEALGSLIRSAGVSDSLSKTYLEAWVSGSPAVVSAMQTLMAAVVDKRQDELREAVRNLVNAMRTDSGLDPIEHLEVRYIFQTMGGL